MVCIRIRERWFFVTERSIEEFQHNSHDRKMGLKRIAWGLNTLSGILYCVGLIPTQQDLLKNRDRNNSPERGERVLDPSFLRPTGFFTNSQKSWRFRRHELKSTAPEV